MCRVKKRVVSTLALLILLANQTVWGAPNITSAVEPLQPETNNNAPAISVSGNRLTPLVIAAQMAGPAVVGVTNKGEITDSLNRKIEFEGAGSGVIFDSAGYIVTNYHVVENARELTVYFADGKMAKGAIVGTDPATDLAVIKVDLGNRPAATFGDSDTLMIAEPVIAIGNPLGLELRGSVTAGVISALNRTIEIADRRFKLIQTDAAINPGNSGGALVNADGQVIGISSAKVSVSGVEGLGFAIPINTVKTIAQTLIKNGRIFRAFIGLKLIDKLVAASLGATFNIDKGVLVLEVTAGGPAQKANVTAGDILLSLDDQEINSIADLHDFLDKQPIGSTVMVKLMRKKNLLIVPVTLESAPNAR